MVAGASTTAGAERSALLLNLIAFVRRSHQPLGTGHLSIAQLLQVFWYPSDVHGPAGCGMLLDLRWRRLRHVAEMMTAPPQPQVVGSEGHVPEPCVLHPEQGASHPFAGLPEDLWARIDAWEEEFEEAEQSTDRDGTRWVGYQYDLSIPPGWRVGGFASWHATDLHPMNCPQSPATRTAGVSSRPLGSGLRFSGRRQDGAARRSGAWLWHAPVRRAGWGDDQFSDIPWWPRARAPVRRRRPIVAECHRLGVPQAVDCV